MSDTSFIRAQGTFTAAGTGAADTTNTSALGANQQTAVFNNQPTGLDFSPYTQVIATLISGAPTGGASTPTSTVKLQTSDDQTTWVDLITFTGTTTSAATESKGAIESATVTILKWLRFTAAVGSASGTATYSYDYVVTGKLA